MAAERDSGSQTTDSGSAASDDDDTRNKKEEKNWETVMSSLGFLNSDFCLGNNCI